MGIRGGGDPTTLGFKNPVASLVSICSSGSLVRSCEVEDFCKGEGYLMS